MSVRRPPASASVRPAMPFLQRPSADDICYQKINHDMEIIANGGPVQIEKMFKDFFKPEGVSATERPNLELFQKKFKEDYTYNSNNKEKYQTFMGELQTLPGFTRVISQNMHCRENSDIGTQVGEGIGFSKIITECEAFAPAFYDNQRQRIQSFLDSVLRGEIYKLDPDVIALQEVQERNATIRGDTRDILYNGIKDSQKKPNPKWDIVLPRGNAIFAAGKITASGLGFIFNTNKVKLINSQLYQFNKDFASGADAKPTTDMSFKGVLVGEFENIATGKHLVIFNIHPSPYVELDEQISPRSEIVDQIVKTHMYQCLFIALLMKNLYNERTPKPTILLCGDWNINKFLSNGTTGFNNTTLNSEKRLYKQAIGESALQEGGVIPAIDPISKKCFKEDEPYIGEGTRTGGNPKYCDTACCGAEIKTVYEILQAIPPAHIKFIQESDNEAIVPFGGKYTWDALFNSVMYSPLWASFNFQLIDHIVYSRYGAIPSFAFTKVRRLTPTTPIAVTEGLLSKKCIHHRYNRSDLVPKKLGAYDENYYNNLYIQELQSWIDLYDRLNNRTASLKERTLYKYNPYYHQKYIRDLENVRSRVGKTPDNFTPHLKNMYMGADTQYYYYDFADHYALECVLVLDDSDATIQRIKEIVNRVNQPQIVIPKDKKAYVDPNDILPFTCWTDNMINRVLLQSVEFFPRKWFDCTNEPINYYSSGRIKDVLLDELQSGNYLKTQYREEENRTTIIGWLRKILWEKYPQYCNSIDIEFLPNILEDGRIDFDTDGLLKDKENEVKKGYYNQFVDYIRYIFDTYEKNRLARENEIPFRWIASPVSTIDLPNENRRYNMVPIHKAVFKYFNRFLEREILNRVKYADMNVRSAKAKADTYGILYDLGYNIDPKRGIKDIRKNALRNINRGLTKNVRNIIPEGNNKSISLVGPTENYSGKILYTAEMKKGGRRTRKHKHRTTRKRKHHNKRHTRKH